MEVRPKRNKPFECDQCGKEIDTKNDDYNKIILVTFNDNRKFRNKFCSLECLEKWKLLNKKPGMNQEPLEEELKNSPVYEKEAYLEEEEPLDIPTIPTKKDKKGKNEKVSYKKETKKEIYEDNKKKTKRPFRVEPLNILSKEGIDKIDYGRRYDVRGSLQKKPKYAPKHKLKAFLDIFNVLKLKYNKDEYK